MLFSSFEFVLVFLPATLILFFAVARINRRAAQLVLLVASFVFYAWWSFDYGLLIVATIAVNYCFGRRIQALSERESSMTRLVLAVAIILNLGLLAYFKYRNFFIENINVIAGSHWAVTPLVLPLAISFHTFQQIAYLVDSYRRKVDQPSPLTYGLFVLFFPQLIAGPIVHHYQLLPQLKSRRPYRFRYRSFAMGIAFFTFGLAKKLLIADELSPVSDSIFNGTLMNAPTFSQAWVGVFAYTLALYFDFSGYSDMAVGLARMFGVRLPYNFDSPYKATSIIDFWHRWHITLSKWLRDYLYVPLGGNRRGKSRRYANLLITMVLGGLWHGAAWNFAFWGLFHGICLMINHAWQALMQWAYHRGRQLRLPRGAAWVLTFLAVSVGWVFFRSPTMTQAFSMIEGMIGLNGLHSDRLFHTFGPGKALTMALAFSIALMMPNTQQLIESAFDSMLDTASLRVRWRPTLGWSAVAAALLLCSLTQMSTVREFIYFQF